MIGCNDNKIKVNVCVRGDNPLDNLLRSVSYVEARHMVKHLSVSCLINLAKAVHGVMYERFKVIVEEF